MASEHGRITAGAEPFFFAGGRTGCVLTHGFTATPHVMRWLGEDLAGKGLTVLGIRLPGHGTRPKDMMHILWTDWLLALEEGLNLLRGICDEVFLVGHSTGGALSLLLASQMRVDGVIGIATLAETPQESRLAWISFLSFKTRMRILRLISLVIPYQKKGTGHWYDHEAAKEYINYPVYPLRGVIELGRLLFTMRSQLQYLTCPVLLIHSTNDRFIPYSDSKRILQALSTKDNNLILLEKSGHILPMDAERDNLFNAVSDFIFAKTRKIQSRNEKNPESE